MRILNVHERTFPASIAAVGALLDRLASTDDGLWPHERWIPMRLDRALAVGARGGHGPVRYRVAEHVRGRQVVFEFEPRGLVAGLRGKHRFEAEPVEGGARLRHVIDGEASPGTALKWLLFVRALHDALIEDAFDKVELGLTGAVRSPARWSPWVRLLRRVAPRG
jgi:hypothetical protein